MIEKYKGFDLNLFVVFDALLRHGNVSRAAVELGRSQSAISHALAKLREHFGDELFIKTHEGVVPSERARELSVAVASFVNHAEKALVRGGAFDPATSDRVITLNLTDIGELTVLTKLRARLDREAPGCVLRSVTVWGDELERQLAEGDIDLAVTGSLRLSSSVQCERLVTRPWVVIAPPDFPADDRISRELLQQHGHVVLSQSGSDRYTIDALLDREGIRRRPVISTFNYLSIPYLVAWLGNVIAFVPEHLAEFHRDAGMVKLLRPDVQLPPIEIAQYWHRRANKDPFNVWLRGIVRQELRSLRLGRPEIQAEAAE